MLKNTEEEEFEAYSKILKRCKDCTHCKLKLQFTEPIKVTDNPNILDKNISWLLAEENIQMTICKKGRWQYSNGKEKVYTSKYVLRLNHDYDAECPDFDCEDEEENE